MRALLDVHDELPSVDEVLKALEYAKDSSAGIDRIHIVAALFLAGRTDEIRSWSLEGTDQVFMIRRFVEGIIARIRINIALKKIPDDWQDRFVETYRSERQPTA